MCSFAASGMKKKCSAASLLSHVLCFSALLIAYLIKTSDHIAIAISWVGIGIAQPARVESKSAGTAAQMGK